MAELEQAKSQIIAHASEITQVSLHRDLRPRAVPLSLGPSSDKQIAQPFFPLSLFCVSLEELRERETHCDRSL